MKIAIRFTAKEELIAVYVLNDGAVEALRELYQRVGAEHLSVDDSVQNS